MLPPEIIKQVQLDHFDELRCAFLCKVILKPSVDDKQTLVISGYNQKDLDNFHITIDGMFPPKKRSVCTLFLSESYQQDYDLNIVAYLKDATIISFTPTQFDLLASCIKTSDKVDEIPKNIQLKLLPNCKIYGNITATESVNLILKPQSTVKKLTIKGKEINLTAKRQSQIAEFITAIASSAINVTAQPMVLIKKLEVLTPLLTTKAEGPDTELTITGTVDHHSCDINNKAKYNCKQLTCTGNTHVNIQKYCYAEFVTPNMIIGTKHDDATIRNFGNGKIKVAIPPITPPDQ